MRGQQIAVTNPCGEVLLPPHGACMLGSLNLTAFVREPFGAGATLDLPALDAIVPMAVRMLDDAVELSAYPLALQAEQARATRRIGLGVTGLADALIMLGLRYDSEAGRNLAREVLQRIREAADCASMDLAEQKGAFALFDRDAYLAGEHARSLPDGIRDRIARRGLRNSHLIAVAATGSISLLANNVSSGIELAEVAQSCLYKGVGRVQHNRASMPGVHIRRGFDVDLSGALSVHHRARVSAGAIAACERPCGTNLPVNR